MLTHILAIAVGLGSFTLYMAAFFFPEVHRKYDFIWSGVGLFYALVLWVCAGRITGGVLLGQVASVALLGWFGWQSLQLRRELTPPSLKTRLPGSAPSLGALIQTNFNRLWANLRANLGRTSEAPTIATVPSMSQPSEPMTQLSDIATADPVQHSPSLLERVSSTLNFRSQPNAKQMAETASKLKAAEKAIASEQWDEEWDGENSPVSAISTTATGKETVAPPALTSENSSLATEHWDEPTASSENLDTELADLFETVLDGSAVEARTVELEAIASSPESAEPGNDLENDLENDSELEAAIAPDSIAIEPDVEQDVAAVSMENGNAAPDLKDHSPLKSYSTNGVIASEVSKFYKPIIIQAEIIGSETLESPVNPAPELDPKGDEAIAPPPTLPSHPIFTTPPPDDEEEWF
jgi:hypothetical protein